MSHQHPIVERPVWSLESSTDWCPRTMGRPAMDQEFPDEKADLPAAVHLAHPRAAESRHPAAGTHPCEQTGRHRALEAGHTRQQFGVGRSTVRVIIVEVVHAINDVLLSRLIRLRNVDDTMSGFAALGFPNCGGALDATHIPIRAPEHRAGRFMNRKGYCSIVLQALVDRWGRFVDIYGGWASRANDARILRNSGLFRRLEAGTYFPRRDLTVGDVPMPICVVRDAAYPLMPWLMRPYTGQLDQNWARFNDRLNRARNPVELAFGRLKARFRCLLTRLDMV
ncbi:COMM domain-containing protein 9 isoform X2 [Pelodiscus sinensis]|uniref:COMM domain-containing protein 9 isoform X2 n=1 Tax=Pelodiscus sinensis TaxID=13735 RepID=UPI003F6BA103